MAAFRFSGRLSIADRVAARACSNFRVREGDSVKATARLAWAGRDRLALRGQATASPGDPMEDRRALLFRA